ncbi:MAG: YkgJ family cysteine cluster protein [Candidatus Marinimicrobia bacterium]|nr:YkgJ family cysteine cluster protein [Candidatus Neomarinimicrobiota bacterium]
MSYERSRARRVEEIFTCKRCGYCCHGETTVSLDRNDQERMVHALTQSRDAVAQKFWHVTGTIVQMKTVDGHCIFFDENTGCTVHQGRPWRCGQWPLHPSILTDRANFETIRESCLGLNKELSYEEFCVLFQQLLDEDKKLLV